MWFKNINMFCLKKELAYDTEKLEQELSAFGFIPCGKVMAVSSGWVPPMGEPDDSPLVYAANGFMMLCLRIEEKLIPAPVLKEQTEEEALRIEKEEHRKVGRKEKLNIKDEMYQTLLRQAFSRSKHVYGYIDVKNQILVVDAANNKDLDTFMSLINKVLPEIPFVFPEVDNVSMQLTQWIRDKHCPEKFEFAGNCVLTDNLESNSLVRCQNQDLVSDNIVAFVNDGSNVTQLGLCWEDKLMFVLKEDFTIRQVKFLEGVKLLAADSYGESIEQQFDADFAIMTETLRDCLNDVLELFAMKVSAKKADKQIEEVGSLAVATRYSSMRLTRPRIATRRRI